MKTNALKLKYNKEFIAFHKHMNSLKSKLGFQYSYFGINISKTEVINSIKLYYVFNKIPDIDDFWIKSIYFEFAKYENINIEKVKSSKTNGCGITFSFKIRNDLNNSGIYFPLHVDAKYYIDDYLKVNNIESQKLTDFEQNFILKYLENNKEERTYIYCNSPEIIKSKLFNSPIIYDNCDQLEINVNDNKIIGLTLNDLFFNINEKTQQDLNYKLGTIINPDNFFKMYGYYIKSNETSVFFFDKKLNNVDLIQEVICL